MSTATRSVHRSATAPSSRGRPLRPAVYAHLNEQSSLAPKAMLGSSRVPIRVFSSTRGCDGSVGTRASPSDSTSSSVPGADATPKSDVNSESEPVTGGGDGNGNGGGGDGGGGGGGGGGGDDDGEDGEDQTVLSFKEVEAIMEEKNFRLPADMLATAAQQGLRASAVASYIAVKDKLFLGWLVATVPFFRDRILADPLFFFKVAAEIAIDSCCTTIAEVRKRGSAFWGEIELYLSDLFVGLTMDVVLVSLMAPAAIIGGGGSAAIQSDLFVGLTMDVVLVSLMAPAAIIGGGGSAAIQSGEQPHVSSVMYICALSIELYLSDLFVGLTMDVVLVSLMAPAAIMGEGGSAAIQSGLQKFLSRVPSAMFAPSIQGAAKFTLGNRLMCLLVKFGEYSLAGAFCGLIGQGIANSFIEHNTWEGHCQLLHGAETHGHVEGQPDPPPLIKTALVWGLFMGVSSNIRYQAIFGVERLVDRTLAKNVPQLAYVATILVRFLNNVFGGENFIDLAQLSLQLDHSSVCSSIAA
eukprot:gene6748-3421_t